MERYLFVYNNDINIMPFRPLPLKDIEKVRLFAGPQGAGWIKIEFIKGMKT